MNPLKPLKSINPATGQLLKQFEAHTPQQVEQKLSAAEVAFVPWSRTPTEDRAMLMDKLAALLLQKQKSLAEAITAEMGKPLTEAIAEVKKCAWACSYYAQNAAGFLQPEVILTDAQKSYVQYQPLGCILAVMPWNYPFWQVFRFAAPTLMAGNVALLKHASNVPQCALAIEALFSEAGFPQGCFQAVLIASGRVQALVEDRRISAVTLTGSGSAGAQVAAIAGRQVKKTLLELGGSNAFVVLDDANLEQAVKEGIKARFQNTGQSCIAAKRFIVEAGIYEIFLERFCAEVQKLSQGDPRHGHDLGPLAREDLAQTLEAQVNQSVAQGAKIETGGQRSGAFYSATVLSGVTESMPVFEEETFGPVAAVVKAHNRQHILQLVNQSRFGLGATIMTANPGACTDLINGIEDGAVFINSLVKSDPRLPFGGTKLSGYGRELGREGILAFVNHKTVYIATEGKGA